MSNSSTLAEKFEGQHKAIWATYKLLAKHDPTDDDKKRLLDCSKLTNQEIRDLWEEEEKENEERVREEKEYEAMREVVENNRAQYDAMGKETIFYPWKQEIDNLAAARVQLAAVKEEKKSIEQQMERMKLAGDTMVSDASEIRRLKEKNEELRKQLSSSVPRDEYQAVFDHSNKLERGIRARFLGKRALNEQSQESEQWHAEIRKHLGTPPDLSADRGDWYVSALTLVLESFATELARMGRQIADREKWEQAFDKASEITEHMAAYQRPR